MYSSYRRHGHGHHTRHRSDYRPHPRSSRSNANNGAGSFLLNILLLSIIFDKDNSIGIRLVTGFFVLLIISLIIYGVYYGITGGNEGFTSDSDDLTPAKDEVVVALFYATWCGHCTTFKPHFDKVQSELNGKQCSTPNKKLRIVKVDCSENSTVSNKYNVTGFPTVKIFGAKGGDTEYSGERDYDAFKSYVSAL